jgi:uncharacterized OB-fold protein
MSFEKFGVVNYTEEFKASEFIKFLEDGKVKGTKCRLCGEFYFPPQIDCPQCLKSDCEWFEITGEGKLMAFSEVNYGPLGFEDKTPYALGVARFDNDIQIMAIFDKELPGKNIRIGMSVEVTPIVSDEGRIFYGFKASE